jgi:SAM-dependent methyltransferase
MNNFKSKTCCSVCYSKKRFLFFGINSLPVLTCAIWPSKEEAIECNKKDILLAFCQNCGFIENILFDAEVTDYGVSYENALHFSKVHQMYSKKEAEQLVKRLNLKEKKIIDIGCGDGQFVSLLCDIGHNEGIGFDPSYSPSKCNISSLNPYVHIIPEYYSEKYNYFSSDLIMSRHTLEHIADPLQFLRAIRKNLTTQKETYIFFEVPNAYYLIKNKVLWDIIYEHCSYFTITSLSHLFYLSGFEVKSLRETYNRQYLTIEALPANKSKSTDFKYNHSDNIINYKFVNKIHKQVQKFSKNAQEYIGKCRNQLIQYYNSSKKVALWGVGAKSVIYLNMVKVDNAIQLTVDVNPRKQGHFIPGTGQRIDDPVELKKFKPDIVLIINPIYKREISRSLASMGLKTKIVVI